MRLFLKGGWGLYLERWESVIPWGIGWFVRNVMVSDHKKKSVFLGFAWVVFSCLPSRTKTVLTGYIPVDTCIPDMSDLKQLLRIYTKWRTLFSEYRGPIARFIFNLNSLAGQSSFMESDSADVVRYHFRSAVM